MVGGERSLKDRVELPTYRVCHTANSKNMESRIAVITWFIDLTVSRSLQFCRQAKLAAKRCFLGHFTMPRGRKFLFPARISTTTRLWIFSCGRQLRCVCQISFLPSAAARAELPFPCGDTTAGVKTACAGLERRRKPFAAFTANATAKSRLRTQFAPKYCILEFFGGKPGGCSVPSSQTP